MGIWIMGFGIVVMLIAFLLSKEGLFHFLKNPLDCTDDDDQLGDPTYRDFLAAGFGVSAAILIVLGLFWQLFA